MQEYLAQCLYTEDSEHQLPSPSPPLRVSK